MASTNILHLISDDGALEDTTSISSFIQQEIALGGSNTNSSSKDNKEEESKDGTAEGGALMSKTSSSDSSAYEVITSLKEVGLKYRVICVFGGQSSGKSTLLNRLFGTKFLTMDEQKGRQQTTKGAFLSKSTEGENIFVVDFEGTDGVERGEDQSFERQLSLFALSCADTLIMNMWCHEVGRFNGANLALLGTVFEVNLQLFSHVGEDGAPVNAKDKEKPTLLFVLRDHDGDQEKEALYNTVRKSLETVWEKVSKPTQFQNSGLEDLFDIKYEALPHFKFQKEQFVEACEKVKSNFIEPSSEGYLFPSNETFRGVPLEALPQYLGSCWESIKTSKDLNIPSQREMLAKVRCAEAFTQAVNDFKETTTGPFQEKIKKQERIPTLGKTLEAKVAALILGYQKATKLYVGPVVAQHEARLTKSLEKASQKLVVFQCRQIAADEMEGCEGKVQKLVDVAIKGLHGSAVESWTEAQETAKTDGAKTNWEEVNNKTVGDFWAGVRLGVADLVDELTKTLSAKGEGKNAAILNADPEGLSLVLTLLKEAADKKIQGRVEALAADPQAAMTKLFEHALDQDPTSGSPRTFRSKIVLEKAYKPASHCGNLLLGCLFAVRLSKPNAADKGVFLGLGCPADSQPPVYPTDALQRLATQLEVESATTVKAEEVKVKLEDEDEDNQEAEASDDEDDDDTPEEATPVTKSLGCGNQPTIMVVLSKEAVGRAFELYGKECTFTYKLRLQQIDTGSKSLPGWVYAALLILGFNEAYEILTNPIMLVCAVALGYFFLQGFFQEQWIVLEEKAPTAHATIKLGLMAVAPYVAKAKALAGVDGATPAAATTANDKSNKKKD